MATYITVKAAYGVALNTQAAVKKHFNDDKDFQILSYGPDMGRYINKPQVQPGTKLEIRYGKDDEKVMILPN